MEEKDSGQTKTVPSLHLATYSFNNIFDYGRFDLYNRTINENTFVEKETGEN